MGMSSRDLNRRQFLKASAQAAAGLSVASSLGACSTLDRIVLGDFKEDPDRPIILGGGLAGLSAAYHLKKNAIPFHVYEASPRIGGRIHSVPEFFRGQTVAELGAEFFTADQKLVFEIAKELRIETTEVAEIETKARVRRLSRVLPLSELSGELRKMQRSAARAENPQTLRAQSVLEWAKSRSKDTVFTNLVNEWTLERYGTTADEVSAEAFAGTFDRMKNPLGLWLDGRFRFRGGTSSLAQALFDRTAGFQPDRTYSFSHRLVAVRKKAKGMDLVFATPGGTKSIFARQVICALPLAVLRDVEGLSQFQGPWSDENAFKVGAHSKFIYSYQERFWSQGLDQSKLLDFGDGQTVWESSYRLNPLFQFRQGVLSVLWGGPASREAGPHHRLAIQRELESLFGKKPEIELMDQAMANWSLQPFAKGSTSYPRPGADLAEWDNWSEEWSWAGEHVGNQRGTLNGAIASGIRAADFVAKNRPQRLFP